ncbi:MAG: 16S rRNA methyltransferase [Spirochaetales bacterium]|nr:MAG: 16S rRNA methyltransferase [Spirochaetales bacterium]
MNLILFEPEEIGRTLPETDERLRHLFNVLKIQPGDYFRAGITSGPLGQARLLQKTRSGWKWEFRQISRSPAPLRPLTLILGCPRPPTARRLLKDCCSLGIREIHVCGTDLNEKSYMGSRLWRDGLWEKALRDGAMQGGSTLLPKVVQQASLPAALRELDSFSGEEVLRIALDNEEDAQSWITWKTAHADFRADSAVLAVGPERGWSGRERNILDRHEFTRLHLGERILRTETACILGAGLLLDTLEGY